MKLLDRYIVRQFAMNFFLILASLIAIYLLIDVFERLDNFQEKQLPARLVITYFVAKIGVIYDQMAPIGLLLAGIVTLGLLMNRLELQTLNAGGITTARVMRPLFIGVLLFTFFSVAMAQWLLPMASNTVEAIWRGEVQGRKNSGIVRDGRTYFRGKEGIYSFVNAPASQHHFTNFRYLELADNGTVHSVLFARQAVFEEGKWHFSDGYHHLNGSDGQMEMKTFASLDLALPDVPADFFTPMKVATALPLTGLLKKAMGPESRRLDRLNLHQRISFIFLGLPLLFLALPLMLRFQRARGGMNLALVVPVCAGLAFVAWGIWSTLLAMSGNGGLSPPIAAWTIHFGCLAGGLLMWRTSNS